MTKAKFYKALFNLHKSRTSEAAMLVLVEGKGINEAARIKGIDKAAVSKLVKSLAESK